MRNILESFDDTLLAMAEIEGEGWLSDQLRSEREYTIQGALHHIARLREYAQELEDKDYASSISTTVLTIVYGSGGQNRWGIRINGEVLFSKFQYWDKKTIVRVQELGFELF